MKVFIEVFIGILAQMAILILLACFFKIGTAQGQGLFKAKELSLNVLKIKDHRDHYFPEYERDEWEYHMGLTWNLDTIYDLAYWNNYVAFNTAGNAVKHVYWEYEVGIHLVKGVDLLYYHLSEHKAEGVSPTKQRYPLKNYIGIKFNLLGN